MCLRKGTEAYHTPFPVEDDSVCCGAGGGFDGGPLDEEVLRLDGHRGLRGVPVSGGGGRGREGEGDDDVLVRLVPLVL